MSNNILFCEEAVHILIVINKHTQHNIITILFQLNLNKQGTILIWICPLYNIPVEYVNKEISTQHKCR